MSKLHYLVYLFGLSSIVAVAIGDVKMSLYFWVYAFVTYLLWVFWEMDNPVDKD